MDKFLILIISASLFSCAGMWEGMGAASNDRVLLMEERLEKMEAELTETKAKVLENEGIREQIEDLQRAFVRLQGSLEEDIPKATIIRITEILLKNLEEAQTPSTNE